MHIDASRNEIVPERTWREKGLVANRPIYEFNFLKQARLGKLYSLAIGM